MKSKIMMAVLCLLGAGCSLATSSKTEMRNLKPMDFVMEMGAGWNLGNALDSKGPDETAWGNPRITRELIDAVAKRGFKTIRIPVTWHYHMGEAPGYTIEKAWLDRVEVVVNYALDDGLYVILNTHHENEWTIPAYDKMDEVTNHLNKVWTQIATRFKDYGDHLVFETLNETRTEGSPAEWIGGTPEERDCINTFQKAAVDAIRATGANNATRMIMVAPYGASNSSTAIGHLVVPNDDPNTIISIHHYFPADFSLMDRVDWGSSEDIRALKKSFDELDEQLVARGRAVVLGEWGSTHHDNLSDRIKHAKYFAREAAKHGMCPVWWDNGGANAFGLINRRTLDWYYPDIADAIIKETSDGGHH